MMILPWTGRAELIEDDSQSDYARPMNIFSAGAGAIVTKEPYKGVDTESRGIPFFLYRTERLSLYGPMMSYSLFEDEHWEMDAIAKVRFEGYEDDDSRFLQGMDDREWTMELGGSLSKNLAAGDLTVDFAADILNEHKGHEIRLYYSYDFRNVLRNQALTVSPNVGLSYRNHQLNDYYYGVRSSEATASRPEYHVGDSTGLMAGLMGNYKLRENLNLTVLISFEWLGDEIRSSPIVDKDHIESFLLGIIYMF
ncbi:MAG: MipA/OmpV family protein [Sedimentisphaerales bacterium]|nr:MipA/OmpV family protein [Sedimentisphaerales bacterium]